MYVKNSETEGNYLELSHPTPMTKLDVQQKLLSSPEKGEFLSQLIFPRTFWGEVRQDLAKGRTVGPRPQCGETSASILGGRGILNGNYPDSEGAEGINIAKWQRSGKEACVRV